MDIVCAQCSKLTPKTGRRQSYCPDCRHQRDRASKTAAERRRRERHGDAIRARDRERYALDPRVADQKKSAALAAFARLKANPTGYAAWLAQQRLRSTTYRDRYEYGGNRAAALNRDGHRCQACGATSALHIHHIDGRGSLLPPQQQNNDLNNLITLCAACHARTHRLREREERLKSA